MFRGDTWSLAYSSCGSFSRCLAAIVGSQPRAKGSSVLETPVNPDNPRYHIELYIAYMTQAHDFDSARGSSGFTNLVSNDYKGVFEC